MAGTRWAHRLFAISAAALLISCRPHAAQVQAGPTDWPDAVPLTDSDLATLHMPESLISMLPFGRSTPVVLLKGKTTGKTEPELYGFGFSVREDAIMLTVHALRRQLHLLEVTPKPLVYAWPGPTGAPHGGVAVLCASPSELTALRISGLTSQRLPAARFAGFLDEWQEKTGIALAGVGEDVAWVEIERLPVDDKDTETFLTALTRYGYDNGPDAARLGEQLLSGDSAPVAF
jgi:hypothetical protein